MVVYLLCCDSIFGLMKRKKGRKEKKLKPGAMGGL